MVQVFMARLTTVFLLAASFVPAQTNRYNFDEARVPAYTIPDPLTTASGQPVKDAQTWTTQRRPELMALFEEQIYGKTPEGHLDIRSTPPLIDPKALKG